MSALYRLALQREHFTLLYTQSWVAGTQGEVGTTSPWRLHKSNKISELAKRACIFFASAFVGSMFSGYLVSFMTSLSTNAI